MKDSGTTAFARITPVLLSANLFHTYWGPEGVCVSPAADCDALVAPADCDAFGAPADCDALVAPADCDALGAPAGCDALAAAVVLVAPGPEDVALATPAVAFADAAAASAAFAAAAAVAAAFADSSMILFVHSGSAPAPAFFAASRTEAAAFTDAFAASEEAAAASDAANLSGALDGLYSVPHQLQRIIPFSEFASLGPPQAGQLMYPYFCLTLCPKYRSSSTFCSTEGRKT